MHKAASAGDVERLELLLVADGASALERFNDLETTPLSCAVVRGQRDAAAFLLEAGADVNGHHDGTGGDSPLP
jgi:ankyrin repeat protein